MIFKSVDAKKMHTRTEAAEFLGVSGKMLEWLSIENPFVLRYTSTDSGDFYRGKHIEMFSDLVDMFRDYFEYEDQSDGFWV